MLLVDSLRRWRLAMGRVADPIEVTPEDRGVLEGWVRSSTCEQRRVERARIVLAAADGISNEAIAERLGLVRQTVAKWRARFVEFGVEGLEDAPRSGRPPVYTHDDRLRIVTAVTEEPPDPDSRWTVRAVADKLASEVGDLRLAGVADPR